MIGVIESLLIILVILVILLFFLYSFTKKRLNELEKNYGNLEFDHRSARVKHGSQFEVFVPFIDDYPGEKENSVFIGKPVDFISFDDDSVKFIEVKTGTSKLSEKQKKIRRLVQDGKVKWFELRY